MIRTTLGRRGWMRTLSLMLAGVAGQAAPAAAQVIHGYVVDAGTGDSIANATVRLLPAGDGDEISTVSDSTGAFLLRADEEGDYRLGARRLGYRDALSRELELAEEDSLEVLFRLSPDTVLLDPVQVVTSAIRRSVFLEGFDRRSQGNGFGWFLRRETIERRPSIYVSDLLRQAPGVTVVPVRGGTILRGRGGCVPTVYLDGTRLIRGGDVDQWVRPQELEGVEVYAGPTAPAEYPGTGCTVILLWTRVGP